MSVARVIRLSQRIMNKSFHKLIRPREIIRGIVKVTVKTIPH